jgi:hypothetical protein
MMRLRRCATPTNSPCLSAKNRKQQSSDAIASAALKRHEENDTEEGIKADLDEGYWGEARCLRRAYSKPHDKLEQVRLAANQMVITFN